MVNATRRRSQDPGLVHDQRNARHQREEGMQQAANGPVAPAQAAEGHPAGMPVVLKEGMSARKEANDQRVVLQADLRQGPNAVLVANDQRAALQADPRQGTNIVPVASAQRAVLGTAAQPVPGVVQAHAMKHLPRHPNAQANARPEISAVAKHLRSAIWTTAPSQRASPAARGLGARTLHHDALPPAASGGKRRTGERTPNPPWTA